MMEQLIIKQFLDNSGRIKQLPHKLKPRLAVLEYLAEKFELNSIYSEQEVNLICDQWHTFEDHFLLRRELVDYGFLDRKNDGSQYWRISHISCDQ